MTLSQNYDIDEEKKCHFLRKILQTNFIEWSQFRLSYGSLIRFELPICLVDVKISQYFKFLSKIFKFSEILNHTWITITIILNSALNLFKAANNRLWYLCITYSFIYLVRKSFSPFLSLPRHWTSSCCTKKEHLLGFSRQVKKVKKNTIILRSSFGSGTSYQNFGVWKLRIKSNKISWWMNLYSWFGVLGLIPCGVVMLRAMATYIDRCERHFFLNIQIKQNFNLPHQFIFMPEKMRKMMICAKNFVDEIKLYYALMNVWILFMPFNKN